MWTTRASSRASSAPVDTHFFVQSDSIIRGPTVYIHKFSGALWALSNLIDINMCYRHDLGGGGKGGAGETALVSCIMDKQTGITFNLI